MKKILAICTSPDKGGLELYFVKMVNHYHKTNNVTSVCRSNSEIYKIIESPIINIKKISLFNIFFSALRLAKYVNEEKINIIHVSWTKDLLLSVLVKIFSKNKLNILYYRQMKLTRPKKDIFHNFIYKRISLILVITNKLLNECQRFLPVKKNRIRKLTYGVSIPKIKHDAKDEIFGNYNLDKNFFTIGIFSRIEDQKGQHLVLEALNKIANRDIQLLIVGHSMDTDYMKYLTKIIKKYNLSDRVSFAPFVEEPMSIMSKVDLVILPTYEETFGLVLAEAMLMGTPVIGSNAGGVPEIISDGINGLLFETKNYISLKNKILLVYKDEELRKKLSNNAKIFANTKYNYQKHFSNLDKIYTEL